MAPEPRKTLTLNRPKTYTVVPVKPAIPSYTPPAAPIKKTKPKPMSKKEKAEIKRKQEEKVKSWKEKYLPPVSVYSEGSKLGKFAIFKVIECKAGAFFVSLHETEESARKEAERIKDKILDKEKIITFTLFVIEIKGELSCTTDYEPNSTWIK